MTDKISPSLTKRLGRPKSQPVAAKDCPDPRHQGGQPVAASGFHRKPDGAGGLAWRCKECANRVARESDQAKRRRIGEEAWKNLNREKRAKNRARQRAGEINGYDKAQQIARRTAQRLLVASHPDEYEELRRAERAAGADHQQARNRALKALADRHGSEWVTLYAQQRQAQGLPPVALR